MKKSGYGILLIVGASALYGFIPTITKQLLDAGAGSLTLQLLTNFVALIVVAAILRIRSVNVRINVSQGIRIFLLGAVPLQATFLLLSTAYLVLPAGIVTMLHFIYPVLTMLAMTFFFREKMTLAKLAAIACALIGVGLIANPLGGGTVASSGVIFALLSGVAYCVFVISNSRSRYSNMDIFVVMFWIFAFSVAGYCIYRLVTGRLIIGQSLDKWYFFLAIGVMTVVALMLFTSGVRRLGATDAAIVNLLEPVVSVVLSVLVYRDQLSSGILGGCFLIVVSVFIVTMQNRIRNE